MSDVMGASKLGDILDTIADRAPRLRAAGVRRVLVLDIEIELDAPADTATPASVLAAITDEDTATGNPLDDPATFGRKDRTPGFDISDMPPDDE